MVPGPCNFLTIITMYYETRDYPTHNSGEGYERGTRERASWGLGLGILGTVLGGAALLKRGGVGDVFGGVGGGVPANVNINGGFSTGPTAFEAYQHECEDVLALTNELWRQKTGTLVALAEQRNVDVREKFGLYVNNRDNIDGVNDRVTRELFDLYKYTRDQDDATKERISKLEARVAVNEAVRPYQDKIIQMGINGVLNEAVNYTDRKTCRMITGAVVIPNTPTITGFGSYCCGSQQAAS